ncbi:MAG: phosphomannomutase/phosphoglucomutase [Gammaproteobacteria bacterium]|nr:phosphomannomutase/phosphoglucomutase [Gammaproteobacteria bacterium]
MAKKKAPDQAPVATTAPTPADTAPADASPAPRLRSGLLPIMLPVLAGSVVVVLVTGLLLFMLVIQGGSQRQMAILGTNAAQQFLGYLVQQARTFDALTGALARDPAVLAALQDGTPEAIAARTASLKQQLPAATNVQLYTRGSAKKDARTEPPVSFAQLDMVARAEKNDSALPEIHLQEQKKFLTVVKAVQDGNRTIGTLLVSFDFSQIQPLMPQLAGELGFVEVIQTFSQKPTVLYTSGDAAHKHGEGYPAQSDMMHFSARFYPATAVDAIGANGGLLWTLIGVAAALVAGLGFASHFLLNRALQTNATALAAHFQALTSRDKPVRKFTLGIFASLSQTIERLFLDYDARTRSAAQKAQVTAGKSKSLPDFEPSRSKLDDLDLDIHEDDSDLLSTASDHDTNPLLMEDDGPDSLDLDTVDMAVPQNVRIDVKISPQIFRAYDIRGIVGDTLDHDVAHAIGRAVGSEARDRSQSAVIVARDGRHSSQDLVQAVAEGIMASGVNVIDIGMVPTPVLYYATKTLTTRSGIMITGSHNPPEYNGFKIVINDETLALDRIQALKKRIDEGKLHKGKGAYERQEVSADYIGRINNDVVLAKPMRVVLDSGNGVAGPLAMKLLDGLGCAVTPLYTDIDGNFPNHHPDPSNPENLEDLIDNVQRTGADLGIALDGDGDRIGIVTPSGKIIWPDRLLMLCARDLLSRNPGADILYDVKCTRDVAELVSSLGGRAIMCATGHSLMKAKMKETGAVVGGELSGHIFFNDRWYGFDDALYTAARVLEILSMEPLGADDVFAEFPEKINTPELHIKVSDSTKFNIMKKLEEQGKFPGGNLVKIDGLRVDFPDSWGLVRASNTTPVLVARFEADTDAALEQVKTIFRDQLKAVEPGLNIPF